MASKQETKTQKLILESQGERLTFQGIILVPICIVQKHTFFETLLLSRCIRPYYCGGWLTSHDHRSAKPYQVVQHYPSMWSSN